MVKCTGLCWFTGAHIHRCTHSFQAEVCWGEGDSGITLVIRCGTSIHTHIKFNPYQVIGVVGAACRTSSCVYLQGKQAQQHSSVCALFLHIPCVQLVLYMCTQHPCGAVPTLVIDGWQKLGTVTGGCFFHTKWSSLTGVACTRFLGCCPGWCVWQLAGVHAVAMW